MEEKTTRRFIVVVIENPEDGGYVASVPAMPGVHGQGETYQDVVEALTLSLDDMSAHGERIPPSDGAVREAELAV